ncbi:CHASE2 domain-containing protein [Paracidovorax wautersii]|uniref:CHASE2 domain-containing protein n=1 Tax=Paracidovorax wautersii TaxID=1177982 RepID=UPI0031E1409A
MRGFPFFFLSSARRLRARRPPFAQVAAVGALAVLLVWAASLSHPWNRLETMAFDAFMRLSAPGYSTLPVVLLAVDGASPTGLPARRTHARLLERLHAGGAAAVGFDLPFSEPSTPEDDAAFERAIAASSAVVLPAAGAGGAGMPLPRFVAAGALVGDASLQPDGDGVVRRASVHVHSLASRLAALADARAAREARASAPSEYVVYRGPAGSFDTRPYEDALLPGRLPPDFFRGKVVLVGAVQSGLRSPFGWGWSDARPFPPMELHATLIDNQLTGARLRSVDSGWSPVVLMLALPLLLAAGWRWPVVAAPFALLLAAGAVGASWMLFQRGLWWPPVFPAGAVLAGWGAVALWVAGRAPRSRVRARQRARAQA